MKFRSSVCCLLVSLSIYPVAGLLAQQPASPLEGRLASVPAGAAIPSSNSDVTLPPVDPIPASMEKGSTYIPVDSWIYPAMLRFFSLGYGDTAYLGLRPWTRQSVRNILSASADRLEHDENNVEAREIYAAVRKELLQDEPVQGKGLLGRARVESVYNRFQGVSGTPLNDSFHLGQTIINDYGRLYQEGFNNITGFSARSEAGGRFSLYFRGEYQHAPSATGLPNSVGATLSDIDLVPFGQHQATLITGPIASRDQFKVIEANLSANVWNHEISFGKSDAWMGPGQGGSMAYSNNAENIYSFRINRVEPLSIPLLSRLTGPFRYDFMVGSLKGHSYPNAPWVHVEKLSFKPTRNFEAGFNRSVVWGGEGHVPITIDSFLRSFFSFQNVTVEKKQSRKDPGARFGSFDFSYRLPYLRDWVTLYTDSTVHDDMSAISAPRRAGWRPGLYIAKFPGMHQLDLRMEGTYTDTVSKSVQSGRFLYWEGEQRQGYTNNGFLLGDWIGRQGKGGQVWLTYHLSPSESVQVNYRRAKVSKDFVPGGTTQDDIRLDVVKRFARDFEVHGWLQHEQWKAPIWKTGAQDNTVIGAQITWTPKKTVHF